MRPGHAGLGPVGAGKTTLLVEWAEQLDEPLAWVSLERETPLWPAVSAALRPIAGADWTLGSDGPRMVNALATLPEPVTLVIDDVHLARAGLTQLAFLLLHLPPTVRVVLAARCDPPLPFHVLRVRTTLSEIRAADLAFTSAEAGALMAAHEIALDPRLTGVLHTRTEGWAAGLRMAALSLQRRDDHERFVAEFAGDDRLVSDFLVAEALDSLSSRERRFVLRTAVVSRLNGELAEAITGDGEEMLERLARVNGFVMEDGGGWYRYHSLFAELLRARVRPSERADCHRRAAAWYAAAGDVAAAHRHAVAGGDGGLAADLVRAHWRDRFDEGERDGLLDGVVVGKDPELATAAACLAFAAGASARGHRYLQLTSSPIARFYAARCDGAPEGEADGPHEELCLGVAALWASEYERAIAHLERALAADTEFLRLDALSHLALAHVLADGPVAAADIAQAAAELAARRDEQPGALRAALGLISLFEGHLNEIPAPRSDDEPRVQRLLATAAALARDDCPLDALGENLGVTRVSALVLDALALDSPAGLERALAAAEASGHRWALERHGARLTTMLHACVRAGTAHRSLIAELLQDIEAQTPPVRELRDPLTKRELEVLRRLPGLHDNREIASDLGVSANTVKTHLRSIYRKLDAGDRRDAVARAHDLRLLNRVVQRQESLAGQ